MEQPDEYDYRPLDPERKEIRLLRLLPGRFEDPARIYIEHISLDTSTVPTYEALSYVWGSSEKVSLILVYDQKDRRRWRKFRSVTSGHPKSLAITHSIAEALPYLRHKRDSRWLWIDAISINQKDVEERNTQVQMMYEVYESASCTLVWLGTAADDSSYAISTMNFIGAKIVCNAFAAIVEYRNEELRKIGRMNAQERDVLHAMLYKAALALARREWFSRLWVLQEVLASQRAKAICGFHNIDWERLLTSYMWLYFTAGEAGNGQFPEREIIPKIDGFTTDASAFNFFLFQKIATQHDCQDPRDRIYSLRGLAQRSGVRSLLIQVDYEIPVKQLFKEVLLKEIGDTGRLDCIAYSSLSTKLHCSNPSWLHGWTETTGSRTPFQSVFQSVADAGASCSVVCLPGDMLRASGRPISTVNKVVRLSNSTNTSLLDRVRELQDLWRSLRPDGSVEDSPSVLFCHVLLSWQPGQLEVQGQMGPLPIVQTFRLLLQDPRSVENLDLQKFSTHLVNDTRDRKDTIMRLNLMLANVEGLLVFILGNGSFGISSAGIEAGDQVVVLLGCFLPMVLRKASSPPASGLEIVGPTYIYELAHAQALLGPLPSYAVHTTSRDRNGSNIIHEYKDLRSGEVINAGL